MMTSRDRTMACDSQDQPLRNFVDVQEFWEREIMMMMMISKIAKKANSVM